MMPGERQGERFGVVGVVVQAVVAVAFYLFASNNARPSLASSGSVVIWRLRLRCWLESRRCMPICGGLPQTRRPKKRRLALTVSCLTTSSMAWGVVVLPADSLKSDCCRSWPEPLSNN